MKILRQKLRQLWTMNFNKSEVLDTTHIQTGAYYEDMALRYLLTQGLVFIGRNYRCKWGELDLLMRDQSFFVVIEVRYRKNNRYGSAAESVTASKQKKIIAATKHYIMQNKLDQALRFDVVAITGKSDPEWIKNAF